MVRRRNANDGDPPTMYWYCVIIGMTLGPVLDGCLWIVLRHCPEAVLFSPQLPAGLAIRIVGLGITIVGAIDAWRLGRFTRLVLPIMMVAYWCVMCAQGRQ